MQRKTKERLELFGKSQCVGVRTSRAASVLLSDPCFQLHSIQHLLGEGGESSTTTTVTSTTLPVVGSLSSSVTPPAATAPGSTERKHFSLHACK
ncbi:hypothetical protein NL108_016687 [Boleophthalmus pectinirostris]|nr:hypothetical protein NL108_016687 [Boleophthalmus pectinirostris]